MGLGTYVRNIRETLETIFEGMAITASHFVRKPFTIQYPDRTEIRVQDSLPFRYRGLLDVDLEICTGKQTKEMILKRFDIDLAKCMYCGLCSEPCPTGSIHHTPEFEGADYSLESLVRRFVKAPLVAYKPQKGPEMDPDVGPILARGLRYLDEFASPGDPKARE
jgi:NADH-quinone oxidoreductase subunit I